MDDILPNHAPYIPQLFKVSCMERTHQLVYLSAQLVDCTYTWTKMCPKAASQN